MAWRRVRRDARSGLVPIATLAVGIGSCIAAFALLDALVLRPLSFQRPDELVVVFETRPSRGPDRLNSAPSNLLAWRERASRFSAFAGFTVAERTLLDDRDPVRVPVARVTPDLLATLALEPSPGRAFLPEESVSGGPGALLLSHWFWRDRLGGDPDAVGRSVRLDDDAFTIVGVLPPHADRALSVRDGVGARSIAAWVPLDLADRRSGNPNGHWLTTVGRLETGVSAAAAEAELRTVAAALEADRPETNAGWSVAVERMSGVVARSSRGTVLSLVAAVVLVFILACINVANLQLMRGYRRRGEIALRSSLGAGRARLIRQLTGEALLLAVVAGIAGIALAWGLLRGMIVLADAGWLAHRLVRVNPRIAAAAVLLPLLAGVAVGLLPALRLVPGRLAGRIALLSEPGGSRKSTRVTSALVVAQLAVSLTLLSCAGLLLRSHWRLRSAELGFETESVLALDVRAAEFRYPGPAAVDGFYARALAEIGGLAGVREAGAVTRLPLDSEGWCGTVVPVDIAVPDDEQQCAEYRSVRGDYFGALGIPLLRGRVPAESDVATAPAVMVVSSAMAERFWSDGDPIGRRVVWDDTIEVVGVVGDVRHFGPDAEPPPIFYVPQAQDPNGDERRDLTIVVRAAVGAEPLGAAVRERLRAIDRELPIESARTLEEVRRAAVSEPRLRSRVLGGFALAALLLAGLGAYGALGAHFDNRGAELGVRATLGATPARLGGLVLRRAIGLAGAGALIGLIGATAAASALSSLAEGIEPNDPLVYAAAAAALLLASVIAGTVPAIRSARTDPATILKR